MGDRRGLGERGMKLAEHVVGDGGRWCKNKMVKGGGGMACAKKGEVNQHDDGVEGVVCRGESLGRQGEFRKEKGDGERRT